MYVYAVRNVETKKLLSVKSKGGKYYLRKSDAINRCSRHINVEVVEYELVEVKAKIKGNLYIYTIRDIKENKISCYKNNGDKFYALEKYVDKSIQYSDPGTLEKVIYELKEVRIIK